MNPKPMSCMAKGTMLGSWSRLTKEMSVDIFLLKPRTAEYIPLKTVPILALNPYGEAVVGGMIWPRGYVGAAAFYSYNSTVDPSSKDFVESIWELNDKLIARNLLVCPTKCTCDQLTACGKPYLK